LEKRGGQFFEAIPELGKKKIWLTVETVNFYVKNTVLPTWDQASSTKQSNLATLQAPAST